MHEVLNLSRTCNYMHTSTVTQVCEEINQPELECDNYQFSCKIVQQLQNTQHGSQLIWVWSYLKGVQLPKCFVRLFQVCNRKKSHGTNFFEMKFQDETSFQLLSGIL